MQIPCFPSPSLLLFFLSSSALLQQQSTHHTSIALVSSFSLSLFEHFFSMLCCSLRTEGKGCTSSSRRSKSLTHKETKEEHYSSPSHQSPSLDLHLPLPASCIRSQLQLPAVHHQRDCISLPPSCYRGSSALLSLSPSLARGMLTLSLPLLDKTMRERERKRSQGGIRANMAKNRSKRICVSLLLLLFPASFLSFSLPLLCLCV